MSLDVDLLSFGQDLTQTELFYPFVSIKDTSRKMGAQRCTVQHDEIFMAVYSVLGCRIRGEDSLPSFLLSTFFLFFYLSQSKYLMPLVSSSRLGHGDTFFSKTDCFSLRFFCGEGGPSVGS